MLFKKYRVRNITDNTYVSFVDNNVVRETDTFRRAVCCSKKQGLAIVAKLQSNLEFVKYKLESV
jgi:hypothetical protein